MPHRVYAWLCFALSVFIGLSIALYENGFAVSRIKPFKVSLLSSGENRLVEKRPELLKREHFVKGGIDKHLLWAARVQAPVAVHEPQAMRLKLKAYFSPTERHSEVSVYVNGKPAGRSAPEWAGNIEELSIALPGRLIKEGENTVTIEAAERLGIDEVVLKNYSGISKRFPRALVIPDENAGPFRFWSPAAFLLYPPCMFIFWLASYNLGLLTGGGAGRAMRVSMAQFAPVGLFIMACALYSALSGQTLVIERASLRYAAFAPSAVFLTVQAFKLLSAGSAAGSLQALGSGASVLFSALSGMAQDDGGRLQRYIQIGAHSCIVAFLALITGAGVLLILKRQGTAESFADVAYFALVAGVVLKAFDRDRG